MSLPLRYEAKHTMTYFMSYKATDTGLYIYIYKSFKSHLRILKKELNLYIFFHKFMNFLLRI